MKRLTIIGSTGSIGQNTLKVVQHLSGQFKVFALAANRSVNMLVDQVQAFQPEVVTLTDAGSTDPFVSLCREKGIRIPEVLQGEDGLRRVSSAAEVDIVVSGAVGAAGLLPTWIAVKSGKRVALANKESMVLAGEVLSTTAKQTGAEIIPVDSEHSAIDQCLRAGERHELSRLILTASGGPFRRTPRENLRSVTPQDALKHPTWRMGPRITIDSATLMNKGLEVIEARWLFNVSENQIAVMVHPQSIVHSMVEFVDGAVIAQLGTTDMRQPIQYALTYPSRLPSIVPGLDWSTVGQLEFMEPDREKFPCLGLAYQALRTGGRAPAVLNAADEIAVQAFLEGHIGFMDIPRIIEETMDSCGNAGLATYESVMDADSEARRFALAQVDHVRMAKS